MRLDDVSDGFFNGYNVRSYYNFSIWNIHKEI
jgi:hypothetical protein